MIAHAWEKPIDPANPPSFIEEQWFIVVVAAVLLLPLIVKKDISELKIASLILFVGILMFIVMLFIRMIIAILEHSEDNYRIPSATSDYYFPNESNILVLASKFPVIHTGFAFQTAFFIVLK